MVSENIDVKLAKVDIDNNEELIEDFKIMSVPTLKIFRNGQEIASSVGLVNEETIINLIK